MRSRFVPTCLRLGALGYLFRRNRCVCLAAALHSSAQSSGTSGSISGTVLDPSGAVVANATVEIHNPVSQYDRTTTTDDNGNFRFSNLPFNPYHMTASAPGFATSVKDVEVRSAVPINIKIGLQLTGSSTSVTVEGTAGRCRGFKWPIPRARRSRGELVLCRRSADQRSTKQGFLQSDFTQFRAIYGSDFRRASR